MVAMTQRANEDIGKDVRRELGVLAWSARCDANTVSEIVSRDILEVFLARGESGAALPSVVHAIAENILDAGIDPAETAKGIVMGVLRAALGRGIDAGAAVADAARVLIRHAAEAGGDPNAVARAVIEGGTAAARAIQDSADAAVESVARAARGAVDEVGRRTGQTR